MKKVIPFIVIFILSFSLFGQDQIGTNPPSAKDIFLSDLADNPLWKWMDISNKHLSNTRPETENTNRSSTEQLNSILFNRYNGALGSWETTSKLEIETNSINKLGAERRYFNISQSWVLVIEDLFDYDQQGRLIKVSGNNFNGSIPNQRYEYNYNTSGNLYESTFLLWDDNQNQWNKDSKSLITHTSSGKVDEQIRQIGDPVSNQWINDEKAISTYNANDEKDVIKLKKWVNGTWTDASEIKHFYNLDDLLVQVLITDLITGIETQKWDFFYDQYNRETESRLQIKNSTNQWIDALRFIITYDSFGNEFDNIYYNYNNGSLNSGIKNEFQYDQNGNIISTKRDDLDVPSNTWIPLHRLETTFDTNKLPTDVFPTNFFMYDPHPILNRMQWQWDVATNGWVQGFEHIYEYQSIATHTEEISIKEESKLTFFPNPANDVIWADGVMDSETLMQVFDAQGRLVKRGMISPEEPTDISTLDNGTYFYQLYTDGQLHSGKFIVQR